MYSEENYFSFDAGRIWFVVLFLKQFVPIVKEIFSFYIHFICFEQFQTEIQFLQGSYL